jgi:hypothetical protein
MKPDCRYDCDCDLIGARARSTGVAATCQPVRERVNIHTSGPDVESIAGDPPQPQVLHISPGTNAMHGRTISADAGSFEAACKWHKYVRA